MSESNDLALTIASHVQTEVSKGVVSLLSDDARCALMVRVLPDTPPTGEVGYFLPFDPNDLTTRALKFEVMAAGGSGLAAIIEQGGIMLQSLAKRPYHVDFADGESYDGPAYSLFADSGEHYLVYASSAVRDLDNFVRAFGYPPYSPPVKITFEYVFHGKNRLYKMRVLAG